MAAARTSMSSRDLADRAQEEAQPALSDLPEAAGGLCLEPEAESLESERQEREADCAERA